MQTPDSNLTDKSSHGHDGHPAATLIPNDSGQSRVPINVPPRTGLKLGIIAAIVASLLAAGFIVVNHRMSAKESAMADEAALAAGAPPAVDVVSVQDSPPTQSLVLPGETRSWYESTIYARVSGYVAKWTADIGDHVTRGEVLATIDTPDLDQQLIAAQQKFAVSQSEVKVEEANSDFAKTTYERWRDSPKGVVSDQEREEKGAEFTSSAARVNAARAEVNADKAEVDRLSAMEEFKQVTAPFDGVITERRIDIGDLVTAGSTTSTTLLYAIAQSNEIRVFVDAPEDSSRLMRPGTPAQITADEFPGKTFHGTIARNSSAIDPVSKTLKVELDIPNPDLTLLPGMYVHATFELKHSGYVRVPASALVFRPSGPEVAVVDAQGQVSFHDVTIASDQGDVVDLDSGVAPGEDVALNIGDQIASGDRVVANHEQTVASSNSRQPVIVAKVASNTSASH